MKKVLKVRIRETGYILSFEQIEEESGKTSPVLVRLNSQNPISLSTFLSLLAGLSPDAVMRLRERIPSLLAENGFKLDGAQGAAAAGFIDL